MATALSISDPTSYSEPENYLLKHLHWDFTIDFNVQVLQGEADLEFEVKKYSNELKLDVRDLTVEQVKLKETGDELRYETTNPGNVSFGQMLTVHIPVVQSQNFTLKIKYKTSSEASALCWMKPEQTKGKRQPYLYSQCQAIHARSIVPCQDTPGVKFPYTATVHAASTVTVLMSAIRQGSESSPGDNGMTTTQFSMHVPVPAYLIALVAGDLESRKLSDRCQVWSEKEMLDECEFEFSETEKMLSTAESLVGPYVWKRYDLLVLPPSFPYGGMENPCLTFVTPTLLAGDRSLADVIAHEISHSWTGNLVTNSNFEHFWLNEGHTMFLERMIVGRLQGEPMRQVHANEGWIKLLETVETLTSSGDVPYTKLVPDLKGVDPDDAFSAVPYEKGFALLYHLQCLLGGPEVFEPFLRAYIEEFKYKSITSEDWKAFLFKYFSSSKDSSKKLESVDWEAWFFGTGLPPYTPNYDLSIAKPVLDLANSWLSGADLDSFCKKDLFDQPSLLVREFLSTLLTNTEKKMTLSKVQKMEEVYQFNSVKNSEVRFLWLRLCCQVKWVNQLQKLLDFVNSNGRMKFVRPIYRDMEAWGGEVRQAAVDNFLSHRSEMHSTTAMLVEKDLKLAGKSK